MELGVLAHTCNPSTPHLGGGAVVLSHSLLHMTFGTSLGYVRLCQEISFKKLCIFMKHGVMY